MNTCQRFSLFFLVAAVLIFIAGCSGGPSLNEVNGTVTLDGTPKGGIGIRFDPITPGTAPGFSTTHTDGTYSLFYPGARTGIPAGEYKVVFFPQETEDGPPDWKIAPKYGEDSEVRATVKPGRNTLNFDLTTN